ncbi:MAG: hypothetical protein IT348_11425 [Candidatus Eisenbacteria bacterium]|nr:hypothetical protein [Candidatus Eisenbacteria bacterium]
MTSGTPTMSGAALNPPLLLRPRAIILAVLLGIAALFVLISLRAAMPGYAASVQAHDDRPSTLPDR